VETSTLSRITSAPAGGVRPLLLDGGLATSLAERGHDLRGALWSARLLVEEPDAIVGVHAAFLAAGAEVVTTSSYQLAAGSLSAAGFDPGGTDELLTLSVRLAREAVARHGAQRSDTAALVAASVGPYGAVLGDGAEYRGRYGLDRRALAAFHAPRVDPLVEAQPDLLAFETIPSGDEVAAIADLLRGTGLPAWVSVTVGPGGATTPEGQPLAEALAPALTVDEVVAVGVNCCPPQLAPRAVASLSGLDRPLVVYPNLGARWDGSEAGWVRDGSAPPDPGPWLDAGARIVGGCCGTGPDDLSALGTALEQSLRYR